MARDSTTRDTAGTGFYRSDVLSAIRRELAGLGDTIILPPVALTIWPRVVLLSAGSTSVQFAAVLTDATGEALPSPVVVWTSDNSAVVTIDAKGLAAPLYPGTANISASAPGLGLADALPVAVPLAAPSPILIVTP